MYAAERQQLILERARANGRIEVAALAVEFAVTPETVRRDLSLLERHGLVRRVHGGAIPLERLGFEPRVAERAERYVAEKQRIAKLAVDLIPDEGSILLDAGTTTAALADVLPVDRELTVITNALPIAAAVSTRENITLFLLGGRVRGRTLASVGEWAGFALERIGVDVAFVGTNGLSAGRGLTTPDQDEAVIKRAMVAAARSTVVLCDHSKIGVEHLISVARLEELDTIVTDSGLDDETANELAALGPEVMRA